MNEDESGAGGGSVFVAREDLVQALVSLGVTRNAALRVSKLYLYSLIHFGYFYSTSSNPLLLRSATNHSIDTVAELTRRSATINYEWRTCPMSLRGSCSRIRACHLLGTRHSTYNLYKMLYLLFICCVIWLFVKRLSQKAIQRHS